MGRRLPLPTVLGALIAVCLAIPTSTRLSGETPLLQVESAFITGDDSGQGWTIGNDLIRYSLGSSNGSVVVRSIADAVTGREWHDQDAPDAVATINRQPVNIGASRTTLVRSDVTEWWGGVRLDVLYRMAATGLEIVRSYACYPGSASIETWTTFRRTGSRAITLSDLTNFAFTIKGGNTLRWLRGLQVPPEEGGPFTLQTTSLSWHPGRKLPAHARPRDRTG